MDKINKDILLALKLERLEWAKKNRKWYITIFCALVIAIIAKVASIVALVVELYQ